MKTTTNRKTQTVNLPKLRRAPAGHVIYKTGEDSVCPRHQFCSYSGDERDRCHICHSNGHITDEHEEMPRNRKRPCLCANCGELFTAISSFSQHQRPAGRCRNPERRGLVLVEQGDWTLWGAPGSRPDDL